MGNRLRLHHLTPTGAAPALLLPPETPETQPVVGDPWPPEPAATAPPHSSSAPLSDRCWWWCMAGNRGALFGGDETDETLGAALPLLRRESRETLPGAPEAIQTRRFYCVRKVWKHTHPLGQRYTTTHRGHNPAGAHWALFGHHMGCSLRLRVYRCGSARCGRSRGYAKQLGSGACRRPTQKRWAHMGVCGHLCVGCRPWAVRTVRAPISAWRSFWCEPLCYPAPSCFPISRSRR
jgi:hypothetical protein